VQAHGACVISGGLVESREPVFAMGQSRQELLSPTARCYKRPFALNAWSVRRRRGARLAHLVP